MSASCRAEVCGLAAADFQPEVCGLAAADFQPDEMRPPVGNMRLARRHREKEGALAL